jgi:hypothetical protein
MSDKTMIDVDGTPYVYCEPIQVWVPYCGCGPHEECPEHLCNCVYGDWADHPSFVNGQTANS